MKVVNFILAVVAIGLVLYEVRERKGEDALLWTEVNTFKFSGEYEDLFDEDTETVIIKEI